MGVSKQRPRANDDVPREPTAGKEAEKKDVPQSQKMVKGINFAVKEFEQKVINTVNASGLPACVLYYSLSKIVDEVRAQYNSMAAQEERQFMALKAKQ